MLLAYHRDSLRMGALRTLASLFPPTDHWLSCLRLAHDHGTIIFIYRGLFWIVLGFSDDYGSHSTMFGRDTITARDSASD
jgi:hypothetical protein